MKDALELVRLLARLHQIQVDAGQLEHQLALKTEGPQAVAMDIGEVARALELLGFRVKLRKASRAALSGAINNF